MVVDSDCFVKASVYTEKIIGTYIQKSMYKCKKESERYEKWQKIRRKRN